ncbi:MAG: DUF1298 domain-containing protein [Caulobacteraceae bacterium]|nr:DUF1298 domain-containing protein [Caulobacteraceae bacterium]
MADRAVVDPVRVAGGEDGRMSGEQLAPGVVRLRPDDHFMILAETDASPMYIGALLMLEAPAGGDGLYEKVRRHLAERLPATPLQTRLVQAPDGYDSDVWADVADPDLDHHVTPMPSAEPWREAELRTVLARLSLERLDLQHSPYRIFVFDRVEQGRAALYVKVHHALADGIGVQTILRLLSDAGAPSPPRTRDSEPPTEAAWRRLADARFAEEAELRDRHKAGREAALAAMDALRDNPATRRPRTPSLRMSGRTAPQRAYATLQLDFARVKQTAAALNGTINDLFLALCASAVRELLIELDDLPEAPIVINSARSYRKPEHGAFGNRIVALHPHIATHLADPMERLRAIQAEMRRELARSPLDEAMLDQPEKPFGARERRARFAERSGEPLLPGNISLSNVPGPAEERSYAGMRLIANYPVPIIGSGRFANITSRRNAGRLDIGVMVDPTRIPDVDGLVRGVIEALELYAGLAETAND